MQLDTSNAELLTFQNEQLTLQILGGIKIAGLDRMKVTLKIEREDDYPLRYNLDLYNQDQVGKLMEQIQLEYELDRDYVYDLVNQLTNSLEKYRFETLELVTGEKQNKTYQLSSEEKKEAIQFLSDPKLMDRTQSFIGKSGVVGEEINRLLMYMVLTSRKSENPLHIICFGRSGEGKTHLQETVGLLIPDEDKIEITALTKNALYYFKDDDLFQKALFLEDIEGVEAALFPLRELQSKRQLTKSLTIKDVSGRLQTIVHSVKGHVSIVGATTKESIYEDNGNRSILIHLDTSPEQNQRIINYQKDLFGGKVDTNEVKHIRQLFQNCQRALQPVKVINPFVDRLYVPSYIHAPRRAMRIYLSLIETITFYHQFQRRKFKGDHGYYIQSTKDDVVWATKLLRESLLMRSDELTTGCRQFYDQLKILNKTFTTKEVKEEIKINHNTLKHYLKVLTQEGYLKTKSGDKYNGFTYQLMEDAPNEVNQQRLIKELDQMISKIK